MTDAQTSVVVHLKTLPGQYGLVRLGPEQPLPQWFDGPGLTMATRASDELTLLCAQDRIPDDVQADLNWRCFRSIGPFAFDATGIVLSLIRPLSTQGIGIFVVCTFDGEHILVQNRDWEKSCRYLAQAGHVFLD